MCHSIAASRSTFVVHLLLHIRSCAKQESEVSQWACTHFAGSLADSCEDLTLSSRCVGHLWNRRTVLPMPVRLSCSTVRSILLKCST